MWLLPFLIVATTAVLALPVGLFLFRVLDRAEPLNRFERLIDTGPQSWKQYCFSMLLFNVLTFIVGYLVLATQPWHPAFLNPDKREMLAASTIFNTACSFLTNTNLQHYSGEVHLSYSSQLFCICWKQFVTPAIGLCALLAMIRGLRGDKHLGNYYVDLWRGTVYVLVPLAVIVAVLLVAGGTPMTLEGAVQAKTLEGPDQKIARGPAAAIVAIKQLGTNGGGFFGANSCHPYENPSAFTNFVECVSIILVPFACLVLFGKMIRNLRHAAVVFGVMMLFLVTFIVWGIAHDSGPGNPVLGERKALVDAKGKPYRIEAEDENGKALKKDVPGPAWTGLPIDQHETGNLEGKELRFGRSAGPTWAAITTCTSNGSINSMHDSLNPLAGLTPLSGMWLNCVFGGIGVGLINLLVYLIVGVFLSGLMVGRTPEYLGKKVEAREMKLASLALLIHPLMILLPTGLFAALPWGPDSTSNPGAHGFSEMLYEMSSASANNGSEFGGLQQTNGFKERNVQEREAGVPPAPYASQWDIVTGLVMLISRFVPIIAPIALAAGLAAKRPTPYTVGTLRTDTLTFSFVLLGTILLIGALLFMPAAVLGPVAEHYGPLPFGK
jgi:K+-transporting ATPase ATPase A chain